MTDLEIDIKCLIDKEFEFFGRSGKVSDQVIFDLISAGDDNQVFSLIQSALIKYVSATAFWRLCDEQVDFIRDIQRKVSQIKAENSIK